MRTRKHLLLWTLLAMWLCPVDSLASVTYSASYNPLKMHVGSDTLGGGTYAVVTYDGMEVTHEAGMPTLPCKYIRLSVPFKASNFSIQASATNPIYRNLTYKVYPAQEDHIMRPDTVYPATLPDSATYSASAYYPSVRAEIISESFVEGENHVVTVAITPIAYSPAANKLALYRNISLTVNYDTVYSQGLMPVIRDNDTLREIGRTKAASLVVNPAQVAPFAPSASDQAMLAQHYEGAEGNGMHSPYVILPDSLAYDSAQLQSIYTVPRCEYMIIAPNNLVSAAERIAALKRQKGYDVDIVPFPYVLLHPIAKLGDRIYSGDSLISTIADSAGILREYLRIAYRQGTRYVLLIGKNLPFRYGHFYYNDEDDETENVHPVSSDLYFSNLTTNWDTPYRTGFDAVYENKPTMYKFDTWPNLFVGRLLARNAEDIDNYVDKLYRYELNPGHGDPSYLTRSLYTVAWDWLRRNEFNEDINIFINGINDTTCMVEHFTINEIIGSDVISNINNNHYGYWCTLNHGEPIALNLTNHYDPELQKVTSHYKLWALINEKRWEHYDYDNALDCLNNEYFPMVSYSQSCTTMPFGTIAKYDTITFNIGESFTLGKGYGGPAYLGNSKEGFFGASGNLHVKFTEEIENGTYKLGEAEAFSKYRYMQMASPGIAVKLSHNLLGDPTLEMWTGVPSSNIDINISRSDNSITLNNVPDNSVVAYCDNNRHQSKMSASGCVTIEASPNSSVMVYNHNMLPYIAPLLVQNETISKSRYVLATSVAMGNHVDANRTQGNVVISSGTDYKIEAKGDVGLESGVTIEKGATFSVILAKF